MTAVKRTMTPEEEARWTAGGYVGAAQGHGEFVPQKPRRCRVYMCPRHAERGGDLCERHQKLREQRRAKGGWRIE
jgi:hypothetical protein